MAEGRDSLDGRRFFFFYQVRLNADILPALRNELIHLVFDGKITDPPAAEPLSDAEESAGGSAPPAVDTKADLMREAGQRLTRHRIDINRLYTLLDGERLLNRLNDTVTQRMADLAHGLAMFKGDDGRTDRADYPATPPVELTEEQLQRYNRLVALLNRDAADIVGTPRASGAGMGPVPAAPRMGTPLLHPPSMAATAGTLQKHAASSLKPPTEPTLPVGSRNIGDFFARYELFFTLANVPEDQRVHRAALSIKSPAVTSQWFAFVDNLGRPPTWSDFKQQVTIFTRGHAAQAKAADDLSACVQGNASVDAYAARYTKLATDAGYPLTDARVVKGFLQGLRDDNFRTVLTGLAPNRQPWACLTDVVSVASQLAVMSTGPPRTTRPPARHHYANFTRNSGGSGKWRGGKSKQYNTKPRFRPSAAGTMERVAERVAKREAHAVANSHLQKHGRNDGRGNRRDDRDSGRRSNDRYTKHPRRDQSPPAGGAGGFANPLSGFTSARGY